MKTPTALKGTVPCNAVGAPFFSVVMPAYGVERFIADAVADVLVQGFRDFELIVVDDCSPDRSAAVARAVAGDDPRVRVVTHGANRGVSAARNTGIDEARGEWALFLDPDDRYEADLLECVARAIGEGETDLVVFGHVQEYYAASGKHLYDNPIELTVGRWQRGAELGKIALELEKQTNLGYPWNKAYRLEVVREAGLRFEDDVPYIEDILFNVAFLHHARSIACIADAPYRYAKRLGANLTAANDPRYFEMHRRRIREIRDLVESLGALDDEAKSVLGALYARFIMSSIEQNSSRSSGMTHAMRVEWLEQLFDDPLFCELVPCGRADDSASLAVCLKLLASRNVAALLAAGRAIHVVRAHSTTLYTKVKSLR